METENDSQPAYAVNLSSGSLHNPAFRQWLYQRLQSAPACATRLFIEFPEYGALINIQDTRDFIERLGKLGCHCGLDHFGRGFYSIGHLRDVRVRYLKIDSSFTRDIDREEDNQLLIHALTKTTHSVDIAVIAQAVESSAERNTLENMQIDAIQGSLTARPQPLKT